MSSFVSICGHYSLVHLATEDDDLPLLFPIDVVCLHVTLTKDSLPTIQADNSDKIDKSLDVHGYSAVCPCNPGATIRKFGSGAHWDF
jgi:hypothetical protein